MNLIKRVINFIVSKLDWLTGALDSLFGDVLRLGTSVANTGIRVLYCVLLYQLALGDLLGKVLEVLK